MKKTLICLFLFAGTVVGMAQNQDSICLRKTDGTQVKFAKSSVKYYQVTDDDIKVGVATPIDEIEKTMFTRDANQPNPISEDYFTVDGNSVYHDGEMPGGEAEAEVNVTANDEALPGGSTIVGVSSRSRIECFYISIVGVAGYYILYPEEPVFSVEDYIYKITLIFSQKYDHDILVRVGGHTVDGRDIGIHEFWIRFHKAETGALQISLSFDNAKDIDLHLITPSGTRYYYGNKGGYVTINGQEIRYGLDVDSNAGCSIDNINCENISLPEEMLENGTYEVRVNMFSNCNSSIPTNWNLVAYRGGSPIYNQVVNYGNPASGVYPVGAGDGDHTVVMRFNVEKAAGSRSKERPVVRLLPLMDMDIMKMETEKAIKKQMNK